MSRTRATRLARILGTTLGLAIFATTLCQASAVSKHYSIQDLKTLPVHSPVSLTGVVSYVDEAASLFWIHDPTGSMPVAMNPLPAGIHNGDEVSLKAITTALYDDLKGPASVGLERIRIHLAVHTGPVTPSAATTLAVQPYNSGLKPTVWQLKEGNPRSQPELVAAQTPQQDSASAQLPHTSPSDLTVIHGSPAWTPSALMTLTLILAVLTVAILAVLGRVNKLRRRVIETATAVRFMNSTRRRKQLLCRDVSRRTASRDG
jgi:hypothetical protein